MKEAKNMYITVQIATDEEGVGVLLQILVNALRGEGVIKYEVIYE